jgi:hypothetical protein
MGTADTVAGKGVYNTATVAYQKNGLSLFGSWDAVSPDFVPRLGFMPETDYKGMTYEVDYQSVLKKGAVSEIGTSSFIQNYQRYGGGHYRDTLFNQLVVQMRNGIGLQYQNFQEDFLGTFDHLNSLRAVYPQGDPYRHINVQYDWGRLALADYRSSSVGYSYRPVNNLQLSATYQHVDHTDRSDLGILGFNWDIGRDRYFSGRVVKRDHDWNAYVAFRKSGNRGVEYFLIFGDPNAPKFKTSLILKVIWPVQF